MNWWEAEREYTDAVVADTSLPRMFEHSAERHENRPAQMYKGGVYERSLTETVVPAAPAGDYRAISYADMQAIVRNLAAGFRDLGVEAGTRVGIFAHTRMEWAQSDLALLAAGGVVTTVYTSSSESQVAYLLGDSAAEGVVVENEDHLERVLAVEDELDLEFVVVMDRLGRAYDDRDDVMTLAELHDRGAALYDPDDYQGWVDERDTEDLASLIYTSGTTGKPKGVRLTHGNFRSNVNAVRKRYGPRPDKGGLPVIDETTRSLSYLPLAHVFERLSGHFLMFASGACVAYAESPDTLKEDFQLVEPTAATSVPRVYEKMYDAIREQASESSFKQRIFEWATDVGRQYHETDSPGAVLRAKHAAADRLVFDQVRDALGGNVDMLISGGGSLSSELCALYHGMGLPILEGYGLTETSPVVTVNPPENPQIGTIGPPLPGVDVRVDETVVPQEEFDDADGDVGELLVRGPNVADGYWEKPEETAASFVDENGDRWFRTGDVIEIRPDDYLVFHERLKQIIVLSTGKNVAPAPIEDAFAASPVVEQCMVVGDGEKFVGAVIVPNAEGLRERAARDGVDLPADDAELCADDRAHEYVQAEVDEINERFERHERIKEFRLVPREFTEENDLLTPTMKKKRRNIEEAFEEIIAEMYAE